MIEYSQNVACLDFTISMIEKYIENKIYHSYSENIVFIEDYAFLINSLIDLFDKTMNFKYKDLAKKLCRFGALFGTSGESVSNHFQILI